MIKNKIYFKKQIYSVALNTFFFLFPLLWKEAVVCSQTYCSGTIVLTAPSGTFTDVSGANDYANNSDCKWLLQPTGVTSITVSFDSFSVESGYDFVKIYDGADTNSTLLAAFTGNSIPPSIISSGGVMLVRFISDFSYGAPGWQASYTSSVPVYCSGITSLAAVSGTFNDGSNSSDYVNNSDCKWLIQPPGAVSVSLSFTSFSTEQGFDFVKIYDGNNTSAPLLGSFSGSSIPSSIISNGGSMLVHFTSNSNITSSGWEAAYTSSVPVYCSGTTSLTAVSGTFSDGSGSNNYSNNSDCKWLIQPSGVGSITISFSSFDLQNGLDFIKVYDGTTMSATLLASYSGSSLPASITSSGGAMLVHFTSDASGSAAGWTASYSATPLYCNGTITLVNPGGTFTDGSGVNNYGNNSDCQWLIQPAGAVSISLSFSLFSVQSGFDFVEIYDGTSTSDPLLGSYSGSSIPSTINSSGGAMLVHFTSDANTNASGWSASYTSVIPDYCSGTTYLTATYGTFSDGSGSGNYLNNADCKWLLQPPGVSSIILNFNSLNTEYGYDFIKVYDGTTTSAPLLGSFSGSSIPSTINSSGGAMLIYFNSDTSYTDDGWSVSYTSSTVNVTLPENKESFKVQIFPNPFNHSATVIFPFPVLEGSELILFDSFGKALRRKENIHSQMVLERGALSPGIYFYHIVNKNSFLQKGKLIIE